jgi:hypothetical protein
MSSRSDPHRGEPGKIRIPAAWREALVTIYSIPNGNRSIPFRIPAGIVEVLAENPHLFLCENPADAIRRTIFGGQKGTKALASERAHD